MLRNYFLINLILLIIIVFLGVKLYNVLAFSLEIPSKPSVEKYKKERGDIRRKGEDFNKTSFQIISRMDLFRPSRSAPSGSKGKIEKFFPKETPKLFGTIILDNEKTAILEDPATKATKTYRINDSVAGFVVSDILEDKVILKKNGSRVEVRLRDDKGIRPKRRASYKPPSLRKPPKRRAKRLSRSAPSTRTKSERGISPLHIEQFKGNSDNSNQ